MRNLEEFNKEHSNQIAFIIGSGPSVNMLDLSPLNDYVTIAVNSGYLAFPESDYFVSDDHSVARWSYFFNDLRKSNHTTVFLYEDMLRNQSWIFGNRAVMFRHRQGFHLTDTYKHDMYENHICQARTSVGSAIHIAHIMGCSKIVLIGIDCCRQDDKRYFWSGDLETPYRNDGLSIDRYRKVVYENRKTDTDLISITRYWREKSHYFNTKCNIFNASPITILDEFPKINLQGFLKDNQEGKKYA